MTIGPLTLERYRELKEQGIHYRVFVNGKDRTRDCYFVDDTPGHQVARLYKRNEQGYHYVDVPGCYGAAKEEVYEGIELVRAPEL